MGHKLLRALLFMALIAGCGVMISGLLSAETPHGRVTGVLTKTDGGQPLPLIRVALVRKDSEKAVYRTTTDETGRFTFPQVVTGEYRLVARTQAHEQSDQVIAVEEGITAATDIALKPTAPFLRLFQPQRVFTTQETARLRCHGFVPAAEVAAQLYRVEAKAASQAWRGWLPAALTLHGTDVRTADLRRVPELRLHTALVRAVAKRDVEGVFREEISFGVLPPGMYLASIEAGTLREVSIITVTDLGLVVKAVPDKVLAYAVHISSGKAMAGTAVEVRQGNAIIGRGATDNNGLLEMRLSSEVTGDSILVTGRHGDSLAVADCYLYGGSSRDALRVYTYTDRPVYRPGHTVHFKSIIRQLDGRVHYRLPRRLQADVRVVDEGENIAYTGTHYTNGYGSLAGEFTLSEEARPGYYSVTLTIDGQNYESSFNVAEYRKPEYQVRVTTAQPRFSKGDAIDAEISAQYYFGAPVVGAKVSYYVTREMDWYFGELYETWDDDLPEEAPAFAGYDGEEIDYQDGEIVISGEGTLDEGGRLRVLIPSSSKKGVRLPEEDGYDWRFTIHTSVEDDSKRSEDGAGSVLVTQGDFRVSAATEQYLLRPLQTSRATVQVRDYDGKPQAQVHGEAELLLATWTHGKETLRREATIPWVTDERGNAVISVTPRQEGDYRLQMRAKDRRGRTVTGSEWLWVMNGEEAGFEYPYQNLDVRTDKTLYRQGETAKLVINTSAAPCRALLTIEGDTLLEHRIVELPSPSTVVHVPVQEQFLPNMQVGVCFVSEKKFYNSEVTINVSRAQRALQVEVTPDKAQYQPGEQAVFRVKMTTADGRPAEGEVSLGIVDAAIYAIQPETTENIVSYFYPRRWNSVRTVFSFPEIYLSGDDKAGSTIRTRKFFPDTALWQPATVTDSAGQATFTVTMPDTLTTWRATCRAATADTCVGQATATTIVSKPFLVRLETPRFLAQGDQVEVAVIAHNQTDHAVRARLGLNATGLELRGPGVKSYRIGAGKTERVVWTVSAQEIRTAELRGWGEVEGEGLSDAMALPLPVLARGRLQTHTTTGRVIDQAAFTLEADGQVAPGSERLTIRLMPSRASALFGSLEYLAQYPYGCTEQTMSAFLPDVMVAQLLQRTGMRNDKLQRELPKMVTAGVLRLSGYQQDDGGWGWWQYDGSDPWMTAYVMFGLTQARQAGFAVSPSMLANGFDALRRQAADAKAPHSAQAFMAYVLAQQGYTREANMILSRFSGAGAKKAAEMNNWSRAFLALARAKSGHVQSGQELLDAVWSDFAAGNLLRNAQTNPWEHYAETDYASALLFAASDITPRDPRLEGLVGWLLERRHGNRWQSTRDTAFTLYGLSRYLAESDELQPDLQAQVTVNGNPVLSRRFTAADIGKPELAITLDAAQLASRRAEVALTIHGRGKLYYSAVLEYRNTAALQRPAAGDGGLTISRSYRKLAAGRRDHRPNTAPSQSSFTTGDIIEVTLQVQATRPIQYLMIEDPLPAGCEARDRGGIARWDWDYWWANQIVRDEQVCFAVRHLEKGKNRSLTYRIYAQTPGSFTAMPARIYDMYNPAAWADSGVQDMKIR